MSEPIRYEVNAHVATITLDQPDNRNALGEAMLRAIIAALETARDDGDVRCVVLRSSHDRIFSAGGDLSQFGDDRGPVTKYLGLDLFPTVFRLIGDLGKPVVCAANGHVLAGAFGLMLACDLVIAKESVRFGCPEINIGAFPFMISALIYRNVGRLKANELMMLGDQITAGEAERLGIVNIAVADDEFDAVVDDWTSRLATKSPMIMKLGKNAIAATQDLSRDAALDYLQAQLALAFTTNDLVEGVTAFFEKREANWSGT